jgi:hypothetical protein
LNSRRNRNRYRSRYRYRNRNRNHNLARCLGWHPAFFWGVVSQSQPFGPFSPFGPFGQSQCNSWKLSNVMPTIFHPK